ncbi:hypothetical protein I4F81_005086 [Pyropia yezoensis]|uniref:Uncharacterized protein n=1 Tax=Pyropia yezoensis TaxID=2788 RepID=A0ACC3BY57_PYRYE|nr:hypothetical protein I4F81_005086 [Neopyropia yezoensis]
MSILVLAPVAMAAAVAFHIWGKPRPDDEDAATGPSDDGLAKVGEDDLPPVPPLVAGAPAGNAWTPPSDAVVRVEDG